MDTGRLSGERLSAGVNVLGPVTRERRSILAGHGSDDFYHLPLAASEKDRGQVRRAFEARGTHIL